MVGDYRWERSDKAKLDRNDSPGSGATVTRSSVKGTVVRGLEQRRADRNHSTDWSMCCPWRGRKENEEQKEPRWNVRRPSMNESNESEVVRHVEKGNALRWRRSELGTAPLAPVSVPDFASARASAR